MKRVYIIFAIAFAVLLIVTRLYIYPQLTADTEIVAVIIFLVIGLFGYLNLRKSENIYDKKRAIVGILIGIVIAILFIVYYLSRYLKVFDISVMLVVALIGLTALLILRSYSFEYSVKKYYGNNR